ncbi:hypothetical protein, partial [Pararhizobium polonicum]|uniref:hypothetical protein n=1 Tax=Pararhizobium polonicum TaxID=1612624 RepID=UPI001AECFBC1
LNQNKTGLQIRPDEALPLTGVFLTLCDSRTWRGRNTRTGHHTAETAWLTRSGVENFELGLTGGTSPPTWRRRLAIPNPLSQGQGQLQLTFGKRVNECGYIARTSKNRTAHSPHKTNDNVEFYYRHRT